MRCCVGVLGNIAGHCDELTNIVITSGAVQPLTRFFMNLDTEDRSMLKKFLFAIMNLCKFGSAPKQDVIKSVLPCLSKLIQHSNTIVVELALCGLSYLVDKDELITNSVIEAGLVSKLVSLLDKDMDDERDIQSEAPGVLLDVTAWTTEQNRAVGDAGAVPYLICLLDSDDGRLVKRCVLTLRNIAFDGDELRDIVISTGAIQPLTRLVMSLGHERSSSQFCRV